MATAAAKSDEVLGAEDAMSRGRDEMMRHVPSERQVVTTKRMGTGLLQVLTKGSRLSGSFVSTYEGGGRVLPLFGRPAGS